MHNVCKSVSAKLNRIQFKTLKLALGFRVSIPNNVVLAEAKNALELRATYLGRIFLSKMKVSYKNYRILGLLNDITDLSNNRLVVSKYWIPIPIHWIGIQWIPILFKSLRILNDLLIYRRHTELLMSSWFLSPR